MASTASSSSAASADEQQHPHQAGPLPRKVGEIGYPGSPAEPPKEMDEVDLADSSNPYPNAPPTPSSVAPNSSSAPGNGTPPSGPPAPPSSAPSTKKAQRWFRRFRSRKAPPLVFGLSAYSLARFAVLLCLLAGTVTGWVFTIRKLNRANHNVSNQQSSPPTPTNGTDNGQDNGQGSNDPQFAQMAGALFIFVHVMFALVILVELVFLERALFRLRAERWRFLHPGQTLPLHARGGPAPALGLAPWNRPSLPTYAAALGYSGTGDIEDDDIAVPPPPAYGNTRGSTLLLASVLRASMSRADNAARLAGIPESRPVSYASRDEEAEVRSDAERARQLELALARLEDGR